MLELKNLHKQYGNTQALADVSLHAAAGEFITLLGESGSGKTTVLQAIAGFVEIDRGSIHIAGVDQKATPAFRRNVGLVFQHYALFPHLTVERNIAFPLRMRKLPAHDIGSRVEAALDRVRLRGFGQRMPAQLSGGQQQRVALARALVSAPPLLLLDEPMGALDMSLRTEVQQEILQLQRQAGITTLSVTHDQQEAMAMADRIAIMRKGRIEQIDTPRNLYDRPASQFVARFMGSPNFLEATPWDRPDGKRLARLNNGSSLVLAEDAPVYDSEAFLVTVRPERIRLDSPETPAPPGSNQVTASILHTRFAGGHWNVQARLSDGSQLQAALPNQGSLGLRKDETVTLWWPHQASWPLPRHSQ